MEDTEDGSCSIFQGRTLYWHISNNTTFIAEILNFPLLMFTWNHIIDIRESMVSIRVHQNIKKFSEFYSHLIYIVSTWKKTKNAKKYFWGICLAWPPSCRKCPFYNLKTSSKCSKFRICLLCVFWPFSGGQKWDFEWPNPKSETTFSRQHPPKMVEEVFVLSIYHFWTHDRQILNFEHFELAFRV